jgi:hypothetical protein
VPVDNRKSKWIHQYLYLWSCTIYLHVCGKAQLPQLSLLCNCTEARQLVFTSNETVIHTNVLLVGRLDVQLYQLGK